MDCSGTVFASGMSGELGLDTLPSVPFPSSFPNPTRTPLPTSPLQFFSRLTRPPPPHLSHPPPPSPPSSP